MRPSQRSHTRLNVIARSDSDEAIQTCLVAVDCFAEPVIGRRFAPTRWLAMTKNYSGAALSPCEFDSFETSEATTMTTAINPMTSVQMALISGFTPSRTSE
jgi:hypothetical protein